MTVSQSRVAILGGGSYGSSLAQSLSALHRPDLKITLYTFHDHGVVIPAAVRLFGDFTGKTISGKKYSEYMDESITVNIIDKITNFDEHSVSYTLKSSPETESTDKFDVIVVATGANWSYPIDFNSIKDVSAEGIDKHIAPIKAKVAKGKKIVIAGGGEVGCELAGELAYTYRRELAAKKKEIIIVHAAKELLEDRIIHKTRQSIQSQLEKLGIKFVLNTRAIFDGSDDSILKLSNGETITGIDALIKMTGTTPNVPPTKLELTDSKGYIAINDTFQSTKFPHIFALGDVNNLDFKTLFYKGEAIAVATHNIVEVLEGRSNYKKYTKNADPKDFKPMCGISLGPDHGAGQMSLPLIGLISAPSFMIVKMKSKTLFTHKIGDILGY